MLIIWNREEEEEGGRTSVCVRVSVCVWRTLIVDKWGQMCGYTNQGKGRDKAAKAIKQTLSKIIVKGGGGWERECLCGAASSRIVQNEGG